MPPGGCTALCDGVGNVAGKLVVAVLGHMEAVIQPGLAAGVVHGIEVKGTSLAVLQKLLQKAGQQQQRQQQ